MMFVEFKDGQKTKLALVEKQEAFLERTCSDIRKEIQTEIGELLPATFHFLVWGSPLSLVQDLINILKKYAVQVSVPVVEKHSYGYSENIQLYMLLAGWEVRIVRDCDRGLENAARGLRRHFQGLGHSFSLYGPTLSR